MRSTLRAIAASAAILFAAVSVVRSAETDVAFWLTVLHNTDGASQLVPNTDDGGGSVAQFARLIRSLKRQSKKAGSAVILVSSGESVHAEPELSASLEKGGRFYESLAARRIQYDVSRHLPES